VAFGQCAKKDAQSFRPVLIGVANLKDENQILATQLLTERKILFKQAKGDSMVKSA
jgi:hypothetical protein